MPMIVTQILQLILQESYKMSSTIPTWRFQIKVLQKWWEVGVNCVLVEIHKNTFYGV